MPLTDRVVEKTKIDYSIPSILKARELSWQALNLMAERFYVGITEDEANKLALTVIAELGGEKNWHRPHVRFGKNTLLTFRETSEPAVLGEDDIYFIDIGPVFGGYEGDVGDTFVTGQDSEKLKCANDCREIFNTIKMKWKNGISGIELYEFAAKEATRMGWQLNLGAPGHRVADFPHQIYFKGSLIETAFSPSPHVWILEIQIRHPEKPFGAFYEDLLF